MTATAVFASLIPILCEVVFVYGENGNRSLLPAAALRH
jgi:hypothetical protein